MFLDVISALRWRIIRELRTCLGTHRIRTERSVHLYQPSWPSTNDKLLVQIFSRSVWRKSILWEKSVQKKFLSTLHHMSRKLGQLKTSPRTTSPTLTRMIIMIGCLSSESTLESHCRDMTESGLESRILSANCDRLDITLWKDNHFGKYSTNFQRVGCSEPKVLRNVRNLTTQRDLQNWCWVDEIAAWKILRKDWRGITPAGGACYLSHSTSKTHTQIGSISRNSSKPFLSAIKLEEHLGSRNGRWSQRTLGEDIYLFNRYLTRPQNKQKDQNADTNMVKVIRRIFSPDRSWVPRTISLWAVVQQDTPMSDTILSSELTRTRRHL